MVGYLVSTDTYFRISNGTGYAGVESHFGIGGRWGPDLGGGWDGAIWRWQDLQHTADANVDGNPRVISIETADNAARPIAAWTDAQVDSLVHLIAWLCTPAAHAGCPPTWLCHQVGIPPVLVPDTQPTRRGLAYHAQGAADHTVGEWWSTDHQKDCPTATRIGQFKQIVIPRVVARLNGEEDDMSAADVEAVLDGIRAMLRLPKPDPANGVPGGLAVPRGQVDNGQLAQILVGASQAEYNRDAAEAAQLRTLVAQSSPAAVADAVVARLPVGTQAGLTRDDVAATIRDVLGGLNDPPKASA